MFNFNRKGISPVVATIAILMITIAAAAFIAGIVVPLTKGRLTEGTECLGYEDYYKFSEEFGYNCYISSGNHYYYAFSVQANSISREKIDNLKGFKIQFQGGGESLGTEAFFGQLANAGENGIRMLNRSVTPLKIPEPGEIRTFVYNSSLRYDSIGIYPVLKNGRVCERSDEVRVSGFICEDTTYLP